MSLTTVNVPASMAPLFDEAQKYVENYFNSKRSDPNTGTIEINGERYILVRASSMSVHFLEFIKNMYPAISEPEAIEASSIVLFDIAHSIGFADAKAFPLAAGVSDPIEKLSIGPVLFSYLGWAKVNILEESKPTTDENYYLLYDHPNSFEADSWIKLKGKTTFCTCFMSAGYSSGWCEASFGIRLKATEMFCRAKGDPHCRFIMAPPQRLEEYVRSYRSEHSG